MNGFGRKAYTLVAVLAFGTSLLLLFGGVLKPSVITFAEPALCTGKGQELSPSGGDDLRVMRRSVGSDIAVFCTSEIGGVQQVTERWMMLWGASAVVGALALLARSKVRPPMLQAPVVPTGG